MAFPFRPKSIHTPSDGDASEGKKALKNIPSSKGFTWNRKMPPPFGAS
jgi:hypothetical protein